MAGYSTIGFETVLWWDFKNVAFVLSIIIRYRQPPPTRRSRQKLIIEFVSVKYNMVHRHASSVARKPYFLSFYSFESANVFGAFESFCKWSQAASTHIKVALCSMLHYESTERKFIFGTKSIPFRSFSSTVSKFFELLPTHLASARRR